MTLRLQAACLASFLFSSGNVAAQFGEANWKKIEPYFTPPEEFADDFGTFRSPLKFDDDRWEVRDKWEWGKRREEIRRRWHEMMGPWPGFLENPEVEILASEEREDFIQQKIRFLWTPEEKTTGYLLIPSGRRKPMPAVLTVYYEPETAIGLGKEDRDFAYQLAKRGFVTLSIGTTEATAAKTYSLYWPDIEDTRVEPLSMLAYAAANAWYVLASQEEVNPSRIGIVGHSFGGKWAMFASCLFDNFACAAWSDPGIVFDTRPSVNYWEPWYLGYHPKPWRKRGGITEENPAKGLYPELLSKGHDLHELHALMAPRPVLVSGGSEDPPARWQALNHTIKINGFLGYQNRVAMTNRPNHAPNPESNEVIYRFFEHFLMSMDRRKGGGGALIDPKQSLREPE